MLSAMSVGRARKSSVKAPATKFRRDIQGLRAVAVLAVVADHLFKFPTGGFVGVDVFFVISGFLITGHLLRDRAKDGPFSARLYLWSFYKRRFKRLVPAAIVTLVLTVIVSNLLLPTSRALSVAVDAFWAMFTLGNWRFAATGTDYFQSTSPPSPLQHFWSLGVEEQFYIVWPLLILGAFALAARRGLDATLRLVAVAMVLVVAASFVWASYESSAAPTWAYFNTASRAWELGVGALLAVFSGRLRSIPDALRPVLGWAGQAGIFLSFFVIITESKFPAPWALLPVLATAAVIAAGTGGPESRLAPLTNRFSVYVGDISYSLYLVHFPVIILTAALMGDHWLYVPVVLTVTASLAIFSAHFIEPSPVYMGMIWNVIRGRGHENKPSANSERNQYAALGALALVTAASVLVALFGQSIFYPAPSAAPVVAQPAASGKTTAAPKTGLAADIDKALAANAWPDLQPSIFDAFDDKAPQMDGSAKCMHPGNYNDTSLCTYGDANAAKTAVVIGDSIAVSWMPALVPALTSEGYKVRAIGLGSCPFILADVNLGSDKPAETQRCNEGHAQIPNLIKAINPSLVILSNQEGAVESLGKGAEGAAKWVEARSAAVAAVSAPGRRIAILTPPPAGKDPQQCATRVSTPSNCVAEIRPIWRQIKDAEERTAKAVGATFVDTSSWFCSDRGMCPAFIGNAPVRVDLLHVTNTYASTLAGPMRAALLPPA